MKRDIIDPRLPSSERTQLHGVLRNTRLFGVPIGALLTMFLTASVLAQTNPPTWYSANNGLPPSVVGPLSGAIPMLAMNPQDPDIIYLDSPGEVGVSSYVLFKSTDAGYNWESADNGLPSIAQSGGSVVIDPETPSTLYATGIEPGAGIYESTDGGSSWSLVYRSTALWQNLWYLAINPLSPSILWAGTNTGLYESSDDGSTWNASNNGLPPLAAVQAIAFDPNVASTIYVGATPNGIYESTDGGTSWNSINNGLPTSSPFAIVDIVVDPQSPSTLYACSIGGGTLYKSDDHGYSWSTINNGLSVPAAYCLAIDPQQPSVLYAGTARGIFESTDGGSSWDPADNGLPMEYGLAVWSLLFNPHNPAILYAGTGAGVYTTVQLGSCSLACTATAPSVGTIGETVSFQATATPSSSCSSGTPSYSWSFGDGSTSNQQNPAHTYEAAGTYTWTMTANLAGAIPCSQTGSITLTSGPPPVVASVVRMAPPFRLVVKGSNLQDGIQVSLNGTQWTDTDWKSVTKIVIKGGASLKAAVPKDTPVTFTFVNPDGGTATLSNWSW